MSLAAALLASSAGAHAALADDVPPAPAFVAQPASGIDPLAFADTVAPSSVSYGPSSTRDHSITISYTAEDPDPGSGVATVELWVKAPGAGDYAKSGDEVPVDGAGNFTVSATREGTYRFYTIARDAAGNVQGVPGSTGATTVDWTAPGSDAEPPLRSRTRTFGIDYGAGDFGTDASGIDHVELLAKPPGASGFTPAASQAPASGTFLYTAPDDGEYAFVTRATDRAGNVEAMQTVPMKTVVDTVTPASFASAPEFDQDGRFTVTYTASDPAPSSGLGTVALWVSRPGDSSFTKLPQRASAATHSFAVTLSGEGRYRFATTVTDLAGNGEPAPVTAQAETVVDGTPPTSSASTARYAATDHDLKIAYDASDAVSGVKSVALFVKRPGDADFVATGLTTTGAGGSFHYAAPADGDYAFRTVATDRAGNVQDPATSPAATTTVDTAAPRSRASAAAVGSLGSITVDYTVSDPDPPSAVRDVELWVQAPGGDFTLAQTATSPSGTGSFAVDAPVEGTYRFYTRAHDAAGNYEAAPATADDATLVASTVEDRTAPVTTDDAPSGWRATDVVVTLTPSDAGGSGVARTLWKLDDGAFADGTSVRITAGADGAHTLTYLSVDRAGNREAPHSVTVRIDSTSPAIVFLRRSAPNAKGWSRGDVTLRWRCQDAGSRAAAATVATTVRTEGAGQSATGTCTDHAGNSVSETRGGIAIDRTAPTVSVSGVRDGRTYPRRHAPMPACRTADALSGVARPARLALVVTSVHGLPVRVTAVCAGATDNAGNRGPAVHATFRLSSAAATGEGSPGRRAVR